MPDDTELVKASREFINKFLAKADVPLARKHDIGWLLRNLGIRNSDLEGFEDVFELLKFFYITNRSLF